MKSVRSSSRASFAVAMVALGAGCAGGSATRVQTTPTPSVQSAPDAYYVAKARTDSARYPYTEADIHFMSAMVGHHAQAILISEWAPSHGASPEILRLAERIINAQHDEIATMQNWLRDRNQPVPEAKPGGMKMMMNGVEHEMTMPGMLTPPQLEQLNASRGRTFDRLFLTFMIQHHRGATAMVKKLFETDGAGQDEVVFKFASDVNVDQVTEIARMERMLAAMPPETRSP